MEYCRYVQSLYILTIIRAIDGVTQQTYLTFCFVFLLASRAFEVLYLWNGSGEHKRKYTVYPMGIYLNVCCVLLNSPHQCKLMISYVHAHVMTGRLTGWLVFCCGTEMNRTEMNAETGRSRVKMCRGNSKLVGLPTPMKHSVVVKGFINKMTINKTQQKRNRKGNTAGYQSPLSFSHASIRFFPFSF